VGQYYLDLYFPDYRLVIECDENGHTDRHPSDERERMDFVNKVLEIDAMSIGFDSTQMRRILILQRL
jgi:very-short-patch-repair endonuclease